MAAIHERMNEYTMKHMMKWEELWQQRLKLFLLRRTPLFNMS
jgi:hypothetical protein